MSVTDLIEQLKGLSASEREAFARLFHELEKTTVPTAGNGASVPGSEEVADSEAVISYARGESS